MSERRKESLYVDATNDSTHLEGQSRRPAGRTEMAGKSTQLQKTKNNMKKHFTSMETLTL